MSYPTINNHHWMSPSALPRRAACPGSGKMELQFAGDEVESPEAAEGTMLHAAVIPGAKFSGTREHYHLLEQCLKLINSYRHGTHAPLFESIHYELSMELLNEDGEILTAGTADVVIVFAQHVVVIDFKFGRNPVSVDGLQLMAYGAMAMQRFEKDTAEVVSFQPRVSGKPQTKDYDDFGFIRAVIEEVILKTSSDRLVLNPTDDGCRYCKAFDQCPAVNITVLEMADVNATAIEPSRAAEFYGKANVVERKVKAIKAEVKRMAIEGTVPGVEIKEKQGRRKITSVLDASRELSAATSSISGVDVLGVATVSYKALEDMYVHSVTAGDGPTKKAAREQFAELMEGVTERGAPSQEVVLTKEGD